MRSEVAELGSLVDGIRFTQDSMRREFEDSKNSWEAKLQDLQTDAKGREEAAAALIARERRESAAAQEEKQRMIEALERELGKAMKSLQIARSVQRGEIEETKKALDVACRERDDLLRKVAELQSSVAQTTLRAETAEAELRAAKTASGSSHVHPEFLKRQLEKAAEEASGVRTENEALRQMLKDVRKAGAHSDNSVFVAQAEAQREREEVKKLEELAESRQRQIALLKEQYEISTRDVERLRKEKENATMEREQMERRFNEQVQMQRNHAAKLGEQLASQEAMLSSKVAIASKQGRKEKNKDPLARMQQESAAAMSPASSAMIQEFLSLEKSGMLESSTILDVSARYAQMAIGTDESSLDCTVSTAPESAGLDRTVAKILSDENTTLNDIDALEALERSVMQINESTLRPSVALMKIHKKRKKSSKSRKSRLYRLTASTAAKRVKKQEKKSPRKRRGPLQSKARKSRSR